MVSRWLQALWLWVIPIAVAVITAPLVFAQHFDSDPPGPSAPRGLPGAPPGSGWSGPDFEYYSALETALAVALPGLLHLTPFAWARHRDRAIARAARLAGILGAARLSVVLLALFTVDMVTSSDGTRYFRFEQEWSYALSAVIPFSGVVIAGFLSWVLSLLVFHAYVSAQGSGVE